MNRRFEVDCGWHLVGPGGRWRRVLREVRWTWAGGRNRDGRDRRDGLSQRPAARPDPRIPATLARLGLQLDCRLLGLGRLRLELGARVLGAARGRVCLHRAPVRLRRRTPGLLPRVLARSRWTRGLRVRAARRAAGRLSRASGRGAARLAGRAGTQLRLALSAGRGVVPRSARGRRRQLPRSAGGARRRRLPRPAGGARQAAASTRPRRRVAAASTPRRQRPPAVP